jgi:hypothetical protein
LLILKNCFKLSIFLEENWHRKVSRSTVLRKHLLESDQSINWKSH